MTDKKENIQHPSQKKALETELWTVAMRDVKPLSPRQDTPITPEKKQKKKANTTGSTKTPPRAEKRTSSPADIDHRTAERLRKGQMPIDARLDLHGLNREEAYTALLKFIPDCHQRKLRCVLVITGKGNPKPLEAEMGVLKQKTPEWLGAQPLRDYVLKFTTAKPKDGGTGALYVLLRRNRN